MPTRTDADEIPRRTTSVPVTTMEEIPVLSEAERQELLRHLRQAEARIAAGAAADYDADALRARLLSIHRGETR